MLFNLMNYALQREDWSMDEERILLQCFETKYVGPVSTL